MKLIPIRLVAIYSLIFTAAILLSACRGGWQ
jgi:hypothetical protein